MNISEVVHILQLPRDVIKTAINPGIKHPKTNELISLKAQSIGKDYDITDEWLDEFIEVFYSHDLERKIPVNTRRELLVEARYKCANCYGTSSLEFHHIIDFSKLATHDPQQMIVFCATCHSRCTNGEIDRVAQKMIKLRLKDEPFNEKDFLPRFEWADLKDVIETLHSVLDVTESGEKSKYDRHDIDMGRKNMLNKMSSTYYAGVILDQHQPHFGQIEEFLRNPVNISLRQLYYEIVDELNSKIAAKRDRFENFEDVLLQIYDLAKPLLKGRLRTLNIFLSFAYYKCDVGKK